jgi:polyisoprenoid-binding protein YceI
MKIIFLIIINLIFNYSAKSAPQFDIKPDQGKVEFKTKGWPNLVNIKGEGEGLQGQLTQNDKKISGTLSFNLTTLKTGIDLRDEHMKNKYLNVSQYPNATLTLNDLILPENLSENFNFSGSLELHGVAKQVNGTATLNNEDNKLKMKAEIPLVLSDFKIEIPSYQGITVADKVQVSIESDVLKKE